MDSITNFSDLHKRFLTAAVALVIVALFFICAQAPLFILMIAAGAAYELWRLLRHLGRNHVLAGFVGGALVLLLSTHTQGFIMISRGGCFLLILGWGRVFWAMTSAKAMPAHLLLESFLWPFYLFTAFSFAHTWIAQDLWGFVFLWGWVALSDSAGYFVGKAWGRRKVIPSLSPGKTWWGVGAQIACSGIAAEMLALYGYWVSIPVYAWLSGLFLGWIGFVGDAMESHLKRCAKVKDSGHLLPGHGGLLDRFDSLLSLWVLLSCVT